MAAVAGDHWSSSGLSPEREKEDRREKGEHGEIALISARRLVQAGAQEDARGHGYFKLAAAGAAVNGEPARGGTRGATGGSNRGRSSPRTLLRARRSRSGAGGRRI